MSDRLEVPPGYVCVTTFGLVTGGTVKSLMDMRSFSEQNGLLNCAWEVVNGTLVDKARNDATRQMLQRGAQWLLFVDADMSFPPDAVIRLLQHAYAPGSMADAVGAYCTLKGDWALPTIDTGTGTWESWYPGQGVVEVIRTGGAFLLVKRHVFERMPEPWFRLRVPLRPIDTMQEMDNLCRIKLDGRNPFRDLPEWEALEQAAGNDPSIQTFTPAEVGEDSAFCDRLRALGFRLFVDTDVVIGHLDTKVLSWPDHKRAVDDARRQQRQLSGLLA